MSATFERRTVCIMSLFIVAIFFNSLPTRYALASELSGNERSEVQLSLRQHLSNSMVDGRYRYFDPDTGETKQLQLKLVHPVIFQKDDFLMLCADFITADGKELILDYIMRDSGEGYRIDQVIKGRRSFMTKIFKKIL